MKLVLFKNSFVQLHILHLIIMDVIIMTLDFIDSEYFVKLT